MRTFSHLCKAFAYTQGQYNGSVREYFYFIDHNGMLFLDDAKIKNFTSCFKDSRFLTFFFHRLKQNAEEHRTEFPYVSPCGKEQNYVRVDDLPLVFTKLIDEDSADAVLQVNGSNTSYPFNPAHVFMKEDNGRVYHLGPERLHGVGLLSSKLAIQISSRFVQENGSFKYFKWRNDLIPLSNECDLKLQAVDALKRRNKDVHI